MAKLKEPGEMTALCKQLRLHVRVNRQVDQHKKNMEIESITPRKLPNLGIFMFIHEEIFKSWHYQC